MPPLHGSTTLVLVTGVCMLTGIGIWALLAAYDSYEPADEVIDRW